METAITAENISMVFKDRPGERLAVLENINIEIEMGEIFIILGPSGCGKSTLLRIMSGIEKGFTGRIKYGAGITQEDLGFVFQQFALMPWLTVEENIGLGLISRKISSSAKKNIVRKELELLGLDKFSKSYPRELSGGMRQRVGIARALAVNPKVIFMDEPFSELDSFTAEELRKDILKIWHERKITIIQVTHIIEDALELGDHIAVLTPRPGKVEKIVANILPRPRKKRSEDFYRLNDEIYRLIRP